MRAAALLAALALLAAGCGGGEAPAATTAAPDPRLAAADEFAFTARRALAGTRFEALGDPEVAALVIGVCDALETSADPDTAVLEAVAGIPARPGDAIDDEIMAVVLSEGALAACPDAVDAAALRAWEAATPEDRYLAAVEAAAPVLEDPVGPETLLAAGRAVCGALDAGDDPDLVVTALFADLFGVEGASVAEIAAGEAGELEGMMAGTVLGGASAYLCPGHRDTVLAYLQALAEEVGG